MSVVVRGIVPERCTHKIVFDKILKIKRLVYSDSYQKVKSLEEAKKMGVEDCVYDFPKGKTFMVSEAVFEKFSSEIEKIKGVIYVVPDNPVYILILSSRTDQIIDLSLRLRSKNIRVDTLYGSKKGYDDEAQVLIAQEKKAGTGFSDSKFQVLYYASDITNIEQPFGRIRKEGGIHIDFVDSHPNLEKHYKTRRTYYRKVGAEIFEKERGKGDDLESIRNSLYSNY